MKDTNPDHYKVDGANFIEYMDDPKIKGFGDWMFANGFNTGLYAKDVYKEEVLKAIREYEKTFNAVEQNEIVDAIGYLYEIIRRID